MPRKKRKPVKAAATPSATATVPPSTTTPVPTTAVAAAAATSKGRTSSMSSIDGAAIAVAASIVSNLCSSDDQRVSDALTSIADLDPAVINVRLAIVNSTSAMTTLASFISSFPDTNAVSYKTLMVGTITS
jgi:hypothetical protein